MRVVHLIKHCHFGHGNVHAAVDLACEQAVQGHDVYFVSSGGYFERLLNQWQVKPLFLADASKNPISVLTATYRLIKIIRSVKPDVMHAHMMTSAIFGWMIKKLCGVPLITTVHNSFDKHAVLMGLGDLVVSVSQGSLEEMAKRGVPRKKLRAVLNGTLGVKRREIQDEHTITLSRPSITTICGLHPRKGVNHLIEAFGKMAQEDLTQSHLYIVGEGPNSAEYMQQAKLMACSNRIHFLGQLKDTKSILKQTDIFVLASSAEPAGLVLSEAREAGCAVIGTNVGGIPEMLDYGNAGLLVSPNNSDQLAFELAELLSKPPKLEQYKKYAIQNLERFHISRVSNEYINIYKEVVRNEYIKLI